MSPSVTTVVRHGAVGDGDVVGEVHESCVHPGPGKEPGFAGYPHRLLDGQLLSGSSGKYAVGSGGSAEARAIEAIARAVGVCEVIVRTWLRRFNVAGLAGLGDAPRVGRPATSPPEAVGELVAASLTDPQTLGLPVGSWTLDHLAAYLHEAKGIAMKRSRIGEIVHAEGRRWRTQETWVGERPGPAFAATRGPA